MAKEQKNIEPLYDFTDSLWPREAGKYIASRAKYVKIQQTGVEKVAKMIYDELKTDALGSSNFKASTVHPNGSERECIDWIFTMDTINFSFWTNPNPGRPEPKFEVTWNGKRETGYNAAAACINRALSKGIPITSAEFMRDVTVDQIKEIFKSDNGTSIPLPELRAAVLNDAGRVLIERFDGSFYNCIKECNRSALKLVNIILNNFKSFRDVSKYDEKTVLFIKRAQILVADTYQCLSSKYEPANFNDMDQLTMFADYRVPQVLCYFNALEYVKELKDFLWTYEVMELGHAYEAEIRGMSIYCCDRIVEEIKALRTAEDEAKGLQQITATDVDFYLWCLRRKDPEPVEKAVPFHLVRCIYY
uniref:Queuosine 5'-phosphate N-glycosylase/hydrolase n=1 Tax=Steinernema glaseri TaxID=37863 RepID=A0A1I8ANG1_9BILA